MRRFSSLRLLALAGTLTACIVDFDGLTGGAAGGAAGAAGTAGGGGAAGTNAGATGKAGSSGGPAGSGGTSGSSSGSAGSSAGTGGSSAGTGGSSSGSAGSSSGSAGGAGKAGASGKAGSSGSAGSGGAPGPTALWNAGSADGGPGVTALAIDGTDVYFAQGGKLRRVPLAGGPAVDLGASAATSMAASTGRLFQASPTTVTACDLPACASPTTLATGHPTGVATDGTSVFWSDKGTPPDLTDGTVSRSPLFGAAVTLLTQGKNEWNTAAVAAADGLVVFANGADAATVSGGIRSVPASGPGVMMSTEIAEPVAAPTAVALFGGKVYWAEGGASSKLRRCVVTSCTAGDVVGTSPYPTVGVRGLVVDASGLVWTNDAGSPSGSTVLACSGETCSGAPKLVKSGLLSPGALAVTASLVVFGDAQKGGTVWIAPRP